MENDDNGFYLLCNAATITSRGISGNITTSVSISSSSGTRIPLTSARSLLPVSSFTHSRITDVPLVDSTAADVSLLIPDDRCVRAAVVTISSSSSGRGILGGSGNARLVRRGGRVEPMSGSKSRAAIWTKEGGKR